MSNFREILKDTRRELLMAIIFDSLGIFIPDTNLRLTVQVIGILVISILIYVKPTASVALPNRFTLLLKWLVVVGGGYLAIPYIWLWGVNSGSDLILVLIAITIGILTMPIFIFGKKDDFNEYYLGIFGWIAGAVVLWVVNSSNGSLYCFLIPLFVIGIGGVVSKSISGLWLGSNLIAGGVYAYLWIYLIESNILSAFFPATVASISSAMITGLAFVVIFEMKN